MLNDIVDELTADELYLYSRQILLEGWDVDAQQRLKNSRILMIGAGGLGCASAEILARSGVGSLDIMDFDTIDPSNLQRQIAFSHEHVGQSKAQILKQHLQHINPYIQVQFYHQAFDEQIDIQWLKQFDIVLDGSDRFKTRYLVNALCKQAQVTLISASAIGLNGQLLMATDDSACYQCLFPPIDEKEQISCATSGVLASVPIVMGSLQAHYTLIYLGLNQMPLKNKLLIWNGLNMTQKIIPFTQDEMCQICHNNKR